MNPAHEILWADRSRSGRLALEENDLETAEEHLTAALQLAPDQPRRAESLFHMARLRFAQQRVAEAEALDREALALRPGHPLSCLVIALFYAENEPAILQLAVEEAERRFGADSWQLARLRSRQAIHDYIGFGGEEEDVTNP